MKKNLNISREFLAIFSFMLNGLMLANATTIFFSAQTDKDPNKPGVQVCANDTVFLNATLSLGDEAPYKWEYNDNNGNASDWITFGDNSMFAIDVNNPKPNSAFCRQYRVTTANSSSPYSSISNVLLVCSMPDIGPITINAPDFVCQDAPNTTVTADATNAIRLSIQSSPGGTGRPVSVIGSPMIFNHNSTYWGPITFTARANGCVNGIFTNNARVVNKVVTVRRAFNTPYMESTVISGPTNVCKGDAVVYKATNSRAFGDPSFSFELDNPTAGTLLNGSSSSNGSKTIIWNPDFNGSNPVKITAYANGCLNPPGNNNGAIGLGSAGNLNISFVPRSIVSSFSLEGSTPICPEVCRTLNITLDALYGNSGNKKIVIHTDDDNPDMTYTSSSNPIQISVCPTYTTIYSIVSITDDNAPNNTCATTGPFPPPLTIEVTPNTAITPMRASPSFSVNLGTDIKLTTHAIGGNLSYKWRKIGGINSPQIIQGPSSINNYLVLGSSIHNSGTYLVEVQGTCGMSISAQLAVSILELTPEANLKEGSVASTKSTIIKAYPSPTSHYLTVDIDGAAKGMATIEIVDLVGRSVITEKLELTSYSYQVNIDMSQLTSGNYILRVTDSENNRTIMKLIRQ